MNAPSKSNKPNIASVSPGPKGGLAYPRAVTDDVRIRDIIEVAPPSHLLREFPPTPKAVDTTFGARQSIHRILHGADDRLLVIIGPCSVHDFDAAIDYATRLKRSEERRVGKEC